jgi:hypothetical protein
MSRHRLTVDDIPELPGYTTVAALADKYGVHKGTIYYLLYNKEAFQRPYKVSRGLKDERPLILLEEKNAYEVMERRGTELAAQRRVSGSAEELKHWNRRVKNWGREIGWTTTRISESGQAGKLLIEAYLQTHPEDVRPDTSAS